ncbi:EAL domain-containing protein [uncultured Ferrimonas sp.]|uniref:putative bifunctional diguanylate cyclase/phosphodiesterase n=1 Tax=uncultured Ferrimonas sp. TaxID=432640 RepID=UPI00260672BD|nr:EAL domain-containing protein [uncultured Ferrimonas sp.]
MDRKINGTSVSRKLRRAAVIDLGIGFVLVLVLFIGTMMLDWDLLELFYQFTRAHESWELDELFIAGFWGGIIAVVYGVRRMADIKRLNKAIISHAYYDTITGLPNRALAYERLEQMVAATGRRSGQLAVLFIDFDNFKMVNDTYGHANGDRLIKSVGRRIAAQIRAGDTVARLGGDEFVLLLDLNHSSADVYQTLRRLIDDQQIPHQLFGTELSVKFSIGVALFPKDGDNADALLQAADAAMYKAKEQGKGGFHVYSEQLGQELGRKYHLENGLKRALADNALHLVFQPQIDRQAKRIRGFEALLRWQFDGEQIPPDQFIDIAEETQLVDEIGLWVLQQALQQAKDWLQPQQFVAVNISPKQFKQENFVEVVCQAISHSGLAPSNLELEITETALVGNFSATRKKVERLRALGVLIAIDDFGTGYSSLARIRDLKVDCLKIDRSFVHLLELGNPNQDIIKAILALADNFGLSVVAEGVETEAQAQQLATLGCHTMQGYLYSEPLPAAAAAQFRLQSYH